MKLTKEHKQNARKLVEFYTKVQDADEMIRHPLTAQVVDGPSLFSDLAEFELITKPKLKPVDLSVLIESGIDCEFSDYAQFSGRIVEGLRRIRTDELIRYERADAPAAWKYCRPRMNHIHAWTPSKDSKCPLPDGVRVKAYLIDGDQCTGEATNFYWAPTEPTAQIIGFEVLPDLEPGYCWPWEGGQGEDHE